MQREVRIAARRPACNAGVERAITGCGIAAETPSAEGQEVAAHDEGVSECSRRTLLVGVARRDLSLTITSKRSDAVLVDGDRHDGERGTLQFVEIGQIVEISLAPAFEAHPAREGT